MTDSSQRNEHKRYVTIGFFVFEMLGKKSRNYYYNHLADPGFPQRIYLPGQIRPVLDYADCLAYQESGTKEPPWKPRRR